MGNVILNENVEPTPGADLTLISPPMLLDDPLTNREPKTRTAETPIDRIRRPA